MKVFVLTEGDVDEVGEDRLKGIYYDYNAAMNSAKRLAADVVRAAEEDGQAGIYDANFWYGDEDDANESVGTVTLTRSGTDNPDYWWTVKWWVVST